MTIIIQLIVSRTKTDSIKATVFGSRIWSY